MNRTWHSSVIALTGTSGSGKSTAARFLSDLGAFVVSADQLAREAIGEAELAQIRARFGSSVFHPDGSLNRKALGGVVFQDPSAKAFLEQLLHPKIQAIAAERFEGAFREGYPLYVYDVPLLFEANLDRHGFLRTVLISAEDSVAIDRIVKRDGVTVEEAQKRIANQLSTSEKRARADITVENSGTSEELREKLKQLYQKLTH